MKKKQIGMALCTLLVVSMSFGCQKTPDMEYVANKEGHSTLVADNAAADSGISISQQLAIPESVQEKGETLNRYTSIEIDAEVGVPNQTSVPIYTMSPLDISEDWMEYTAGIFFDGGDIHSKEFGVDMRTKDDIYEEIETLNAQLAFYQSDEFDENEYMATREELISDCEMRLSSLQYELANAPEEAVYDEVPDYSFVEHQSDVKQFDDDMNMVNADYYYDACSIVGIHDGKQYEMAVARDEGTSFISVTSIEDETMIIDGQEVFLQEGNYIVSGSAGCKYSYEEASQMANEFLEEMGFSDLKVREGKKLDAYFNMDSRYGEVGYDLYCYRTYNDMSDEYLKSYSDNSEVEIEYDDAGRNGIDSYMKYNEEKQIIENYAVNREYAVIRITDSGIISAQIVNPMEEVEIQAENVNLLSFDQVVMQGLEEIEIQFAEKGTSDYDSVNLKIQSIELNYAYMRAPNSANEYTLIPVWDFKVHPYGSTVLSINAIDGTLFDRVTGD